MPVVFSDLATTKYGASGHPEAPFRVQKSFERLSSAGLKPFAPTVAAASADVGRLHEPKHFERVVSGQFDDADTPFFPDIGKIATISLSGALSAAESASAGTPAFSLMRPPGHHAGRSRVSGFCYFNNVALACARERELKRAERVAVLDIDVHHGDGTEELLAGKPDYLFISLHQSPLYPGSGLRSSGNIVNVPLLEGTSETPYLKELERELERILAFKPDLLAVSAGFDTYKEDPIAGLKLEKKSYRALGKMIADTKLKRFAALEGGYAEDLPLLIENFLEGFFQ